MSAYELQQMAGLAEQLLRGPVRLRLKQLASIEFLISLVENDQSYPFDFVRHVLTGYRAPAGERDPQDERLLDGAALQQDLVTLAEDLSENAKLPLERWPGSLYSVNELADRFGVSTKTIFRWRKRGLIGWKFTCTDRRQRLAFPESCVRRFVAGNIDLVSRGSNFSQLTKDERTAVIARAQALVEEGDPTVNAVAKQIAGETGRAVETIRLILKHYDEAHPGAGLFNRPALAVPADDKRLAVYEAYIDGATVEGLAARFERPVRWVYDAITEMRARALRVQKIEFVPSDEFTAPSAAESILSDPDADAPYEEESKASRRVPRDLPPYLRQLFDLPLLTKEGERALFRQMNYLKFRADAMRQQIDPEDVSATQLDKVESLLEDAQAIKNQIVQANLRLVVSIAKRHATPLRDFFEIVSDGNISLMRAVDKFDYSRGFKFSTYASWAIMKNYARSMPDQRQHYDRYQTGREELLGIVPSPSLDEHENDYLPALRQRIDGMLDTLEEREQIILKRRFGLDGGGEPQTLEQIGQRFGVSKERIRQLEARAMAKLREDFEESAEKVLAS